MAAKWFYCNGTWSSIGIVWLPFVPMECDILPSSTDHLTRVRALNARLIIGRHSQAKYSSNYAPLWDMMGERSRGERQWRREKTMWQVRALLKLLFHTATREATTFFWCNEMTVRTISGELDLKVKVARVRSSSTWSGSTPQPDVGEVLSWSVRRTCWNWA